MGERFGKYELLRRIGVGGMGEVFVARAHGAEGFVKDVVIKRIIPAYTEDPEFVEMFIREARLAARLRHANIVQILDFDQVDGQYYIAMEWVDGPDLRKVQSASRRRGIAMPPTLALHVGVEALKGLHYAHHKSEGGQGLGIVHRDVSPHNLLVSFAGEVKIADFGVAKVAALASSTRPGALKGKLTYMSPEQVRGGEVDQRSDLYSLGVVLWELLSGRRLYGDRASEGELIAAVQRAEIPPLSPAEVVDVPPELVEAVNRLLRPEIDERFPSAAEALPHLTRVAGAGDALVVGEYLRRLLPEEAERDHRGHTAILTAKPPPPQPRSASPQEPTHTQRAEDSEASSDPVPASAELAAAASPTGSATAGLQSSEVDAEADGFERLSWPAGTALTGGRSTLRVTVGFGALCFVLAGAATWLSVAASPAVEVPEPRPAAAFVVRNSTPPAEISVEGVPLGKRAATRLRAPAGSVLHVTAERDGRIEDRWVSLGAETKQTLAVALRPDTPVEDVRPTMAPKAAVPEAAVPKAAVPKAAVPKAARAVSRAEPEPRRRITKRRRRRPARSRKRSDAGGARTTQLSPKKTATGVLTIIVSPWASIEIDGKMMGSTPLLGYRMPVGRHVVKLRNLELGRNETIVLMVSTNRTKKVRRDWLR